MFELFLMICFVAVTCLMWVFHRITCKDYERTIREQEYLIKVLDGALQRYRDKRLKQMKKELDTNAF